MSPDTYKKLQSVGYTGAIDDTQAFMDWRNGLDEYTSEYVGDTLNGRVPSYWKFYQEALKYKDNNPYLYTQMLGAIDNYRSQVFVPNFKQQMEEDFGYYNARQNFDNERFANLSSAFEKYRESAHTEDVTNPINQIGLRKVAGINDDLNGGSSIGSQEPGNIDQSENIPATLNPGDSSLFDTAKSIFDISSNFVNLVIGSYTGLKNIQGMDLDNELKSLSLGNTVTSELWNIIKDSTGEVLNNGIFKSGSDVTSLLKDGKFYSSISQAVKNRIDSLPYSHRTKQRYSKMVDNLIYSFDDDGTYNFSARYETELNNMISQLAKSRSGLTESYGSIGADTSSQQALRWISENFYKPLNKDLLNLKSLETQYNLRVKSKSLQIGLPEIEADASFAEKKLRSELKESAQRITKTFKDMNDKLEYNRHLSPSWKLAIQSALAGVEGLIFSKISF